MKKIFYFIELNKWKLLAVAILFFIFFIFSPLKYDLGYFGSSTGYEFFYEFLLGDIFYYRVFDLFGAIFIGISHLVMFLVCYFWASIFIVISDMIKDEDEKILIFKKILLLIVALVIFSYITFYIFGILLNIIG